MPRYIDAEALRKRLKDFSDWCRDGRKQGVDFVLDCPLPDMPTADVQEVKHGRWEHTDDGAARCTSCKRKMNPYVYGYAYCPLCGARMDGDEE